MPSTHPRVATSRPRASRPTATWPGWQRAELGHELGLFDRRSPDDDALDPGQEPLTRRFDAPHATARLHLARHARADRLDHTEIRALAGAGGVEVDDVDPRRARGLEVAGDPHRVVVVDRLRVEVALVEPDTLPVAEVDRRVELEPADAQRLPLVDGMPPVPSIFTASRNAPRDPLERRLDDVVAVSPGERAHVQGDPRREGEGAPELLGELRVERADPLDDRVDLVDEERPAREVEGHLHERLVERDERRREAAHAGLVAERLP